MKTVILLLSFGFIASPSFGSTSTFNLATAPAVFTKHQSALFTKMATEATFSCTSETKHLATAGIGQYVKTFLASDTFAVFGMILPTMAALLWMVYLSNVFKLLSEEKGGDL